MSLTERAGRVPHRADDGVLLEPGPDPACQRHRSVVHPDLDAFGFPLGAPLEGIL